ncbi:MAG: hypothetical protein KBD12_00390 [Candidatus Pacebacteria bacterium]|nr:hypothetical protein [Candidatus Paceibacterota bacterium]
MNTENSQNENNNQKTFVQRNSLLVWLVFALIILFFFFSHLELRNPFFSNDVKKDTSIVNAINNNSKDIINKLDEVGNKIGDKVDKNTEENKKGFQKVADSISAKKCCVETPPCPKVAPKKPTLKPSPKKPSRKPCPCDTVKVKKPDPVVVIAQKPECQYILWNVGHTQKKIFRSAEERKKFADEHGLIIHEEK